MRLKTITIWKFTDQLNQPVSERYNNFTSSVRKQKQKQGKITCKFYICPINLCMKICLKSDPCVVSTCISTLRYWLYSQWKSFKSNIKLTRLSHTNLRQFICICQWDSYVPSVINMRLLWNSSYTRPSYVMNKTKAKIGKSN